MFVYNSCGIYGINVFTAAQTLYYGKATFRYVVLAHIMIITGAITAVVHVVFLGFM